MDQRMTALILANLMPLVIAAGVVAAAIGLRRLNRRLSMSTILIAVHGVTVLATVVPSFFGMGGGEFPFDDIYIPYFVYPGPMLAYVNSQISHLFWPWLQTAAGYHEGSYLCIVAIPALLNILLGSLFWMLAGRLFERGMKMGAANKALHATSEPAPGAASSSHEG